MALSEPLPYTPEDWPPLFDLRDDPPQESIPDAGLLARLERLEAEITDLKARTLLAPKGWTQCVSFNKTGRMNLSRPTRPKVMARSVMIFHS
jgi:hypothetical protein